MEETPHDARRMTPPANPFRAREWVHVAGLVFVTALLRVAFLAGPVAAARRGRRCLCSRCVDHLARGLDLAWKEWRCGHGQPGCRKHWPRPDPLLARAKTDGGLVGRTSGRTVLGALPGGVDLRRYGPSRSVGGVAGNPCRWHCAVRIPRTSRPDAMASAHLRGRPLRIGCICEGTLCLCARNPGLVGTL